MVSQSYLIRLAAVAAVATALPIPLNINLGAYSPALVVGDGAIGFEGGQGVEALINSLQGAAITGAAAGGAPAPAPAPAAQAPVQAAVSPGILNEQASLPIPGSNKELEPREGEEASSAKVEKRQNGFDRALTYAEAALTKGPKIQLGTGEGGSGVGILVDNNQAVAALPGTGVAE